eukprot:CAMPEP_0115022834 /NCGR_PEP_ID=MMETSP0216-20121206/31868_1 /TAXON_ID=223996 /ORGANISM="Protocruzia adherens, Strain Boccale" /LENGTH=337 /DNA_ID=CAMNT_0002395757 /DNA_START=148 /DNA_END=1157 /DNA_ORIENTATION=+
MELRAILFCLLLSTTLAATCNNPLADHYGITLLAESAVQPDSSNTCIRLNGEQSCCDDTARAFIESRFEQRAAELRVTLGERMQRLKDGLKPLQDMEFPVEYSQFKVEFGLALKYVAQRAKKGFRKVNIEVSRCFRQLLRKEIGEMCAVCDPASGSFVSDNSNVIVVNANDKVCDALEGACDGLIDASAKVLDGVIISFSDAVTYLTALGAGEQSEVDLAKLEEGSVSLADDEDRQRKLIADKIDQPWSDLKLWEKEQFSLLVGNQRVFGYRSAMKHFGDYIPRDESVEKTLEDLEEEEEEDDKQDDGQSSGGDGSGSHDGSDGGSHDGGDSSSSSG